jgi:hypothetical protein
MNKISEFNPELTDPNHITVGQRIVLPGLGTVGTSAPGPSAVPLPWAGISNIGPSRGSAAPWIRRPREYHKCGLVRTTLTKIVIIGIQTFFLILSRKKDYSYVLLSGSCPDPGLIRRRPHLSGDGEAVIKGDSLFRQINSNR